MNKKRYFIQIAYDGTQYHGWQIQPSAVTVQELLDKAMSTFYRQPIETLGCGRTDAGVHATEEYQSYYNKFRVDFGQSGNENLPTNERF